VQNVNVLPEGSINQDWFLVDHSDLTPQTFNENISDLNSINEYASPWHFGDTDQGVDDGRLPRACSADNANLLSWIDDYTEAIDDVGQVLPISNTHISELNPALLDDCGDVLLFLLPIIAVTRVGRLDGQLHELVESFQAYHIGLESSVLKEEIIYEFIDVDNWN
jgi:hypothetical protein